jgi:phage baseplate assembly protein W
MALEQNFLGRGWAFPPQWQVEGNQLSMVEGVEDINQSLQILFTTELGERVMQPQYGSALKSMIFEDINEHFKNYMRLVLTRSVSLFEARIKPIKMDFSADDINEGRYIMHLEYIIQATNQRANFVFPFYLK